MLPNIKQSVFGPITVFLILVFLLTSVTDADARRKRRSRHNPDRTRALAIDLIKSSSEEVSFLAGLEPAMNDSLKLTYLDQNEDETIGEEGEDLKELEAEDDVIVDIETFNMLWLSYVSEGEEEEFTESGIRKADIMNEIMDWLGTKYRFGGTTRRGIDCSAFIREVFHSASDIMLPRTARTQIRVGLKIKRSELQFGDLIFFHTYSMRFASHVGIYLGDNLFAHASSRYGVTVSSLESSYYKRRFIGGRRIQANDIIRLSVFKDEEIQSH